MTIFGINLFFFLIPYTLLIAFTMAFCENKMLKNVRFSIREQQKHIKALSKKIDSKQLPPAYREENWMRNVWGEPSDPKYILASSGCELTDAIFAAADEAGVNIMEFYAQFECQNIVRYEHGPLHCNDTCNC